MCVRLPISSCLSCFSSGSIVFFIRANALHSFHIATLSTQKYLAFLPAFHRCAIAREQLSEYPRRRCCGFGKSADCFYVDMDVEHYIACFCQTQSETSAMERRNTDAFPPTHRFPTLCTWGGCFMLWSAVWITQHGSRRAYSNARQPSMGAPKFTNPNPPPPPPSRRLLLSQDVALDAQNGAKTTTNTANSGAAVADSSPPLPSPPEEKADSAASDASPRGGARDGDVTSRRRRRRRRRRHSFDGDVARRLARQTAQPGGVALVPHGADTQQRERANTCSSLPTDAEDSVAVAKFLREVRSVDDDAAVAAAPRGDPSLKADTGDAEDAVGAPATTEVVGVDESSKSLGVGAGTVSSGQLLPVPLQPLAGRCCFEGCGEVSGCRSRDLRFRANMSAARERGALRSGGGAVALISGRWRFSEVRRVCGFAPVGSVCAARMTDLARSYCLPPLMSLFAGQGVDRQNAFFFST